MAAAKPTLDPDGFGADNPPKATVGQAHRYPQDSDSSVDIGAVYEGRVNNIMDSGTVFVALDEPYEDSDLSGVIPTKNQLRNSFREGEEVYVLVTNVTRKGAVLCEVEVVGTDDRSSFANDEQETDQDTEPEPEPEPETVTMTDENDENDENDEETTESSVAAKYGCPLCQSDSRFTASTPGSVRSHITDADDYRHKDRTGNDPSVSVLELDSDGEVVSDDVGSNGETPGDTTNGEVTTRTVGNASYSGPAEGLNLATQTFDERPTKTADSESASFTDIEIASAFTRLDADRFPTPDTHPWDSLRGGELTSIENMRRLLTLVADYHDEHREPPTKDDLRDLDAFDKSDHWLGLHFKGLEAVGLIDIITLADSYGTHAYAIPDDILDTDDTDGEGEPDETTSQTSKDHNPDHPDEVAAIPDDAFPTSHPWDSIPDKDHPQTELLRHIAGMVVRYTDEHGEPPGRADIAGMDDCNHSKSWLSKYLPALVDAGILTEGRRDETGVKTYSLADDITTDDETGGDETGDETETESALVGLDIDPEAMADAVDEGLGLLDERLVDPERVELAEQWADRLLEDAPDEASDMAHYGKGMKAALDMVGVGSDEQADNDD